MVKIVSGFLILLAVGFLSGCSMVSWTTNGTVNIDVQSTDFSGITSDGRFEYEIISGEVRIISCLCEDSEIIIPEEISGYPVTSIGDGAFYQRSQCHTILLPKNLEHIGSAAFYRCYNLESITIPENVSYIASDAFFRASKLRSIHVVAENHAYCDMDGVLFSADQSVFICYPEGLICEQYVLPSSVTKIDTFAFGYFPAVQNFIVQTSVVSFPDQAFTVHVKEITIIGEKGSTSELYALNWGIPFTSID